MTKFCFMVLLKIILVVILMTIYITKGMFLTYKELLSLCCNLKTTFKQEIEFWACVSD